MEKRYQVFISSTYADLKEERRAVIQSVIELNCIPAGMELFPASNEEQLQFIKRVIDDCDYYLLIIAGRYGSVGSDGVSYTEKEFDYAVSRGLPVIAFPHENPDDITLGKSEKDPAFRKKLEEFRKKVCFGRVVKMWKNPHELPGYVAQSLSGVIHRHPAIGWVRANRAANEDILAEINELRKRNADLQSALVALKPAVAAIGDLAGLDESFTVFGMYYVPSYNRNDRWSVGVSWREIFSYIAPYLTEHPSEKTVRDVLRDALWTRFNSTYGGKSPEIDSQCFKTIGIQLEALGLVKISYSQTVAGGMALFWSATSRGERLTLELRTVRTKSKKPEDVLPAS
ncbi:MAG: DUF4062 domain-containing protein [Candidatus Sulfotelmatobacter sp.]